MIIKKIKHYSNMLPKYLQIIPVVYFIGFLLLYFLSYSDFPTLYPLIGCFVFAFVLVTLDPIFEVPFDILCWNNGFCRETGKPWIRDDNFKEDFIFYSENYKLNLNYLKPKYDNEKAKILLKNWKTIKNLKNFD